MLRPAVRCPLSRAQSAEWAAESFDHQEVALQNSRCWGEGEGKHISMSLVPLKGNTGHIYYLLNINRHNSLEKIYSCYNPETQLLKCPSEICVHLPSWTQVQRNVLRLFTTVEHWGQNKCSTAAERINEWLSTGVLKSHAAVRRNKHGCLQ